MAYKSHALKIGSVWIGGILKQAATNAPNVRADVTAGSIYPKQISITEVKQSFGFTTNNVAKALGVLGAIGISLTSNTAELYEILWSNSGFITAGSVHRKLALANGRAIPRQLSVSNREDATLDIEIFGLSSDGNTAPIAITEGVAAPAAIDEERHTLHSANVAGNSMGCLQSLTFDFGITGETSGCNSNIFDTRMDVNSIVPKVNINTLDANIFGSGGSQIPAIGKVCLHADTSFKLRKRSPKIGSFVADATAEHIIITADGVVVPTSVFDGSNNENGSSVFELTCVHDGTNLPFVINNAAALA